MYFLTVFWSEYKITQCQAYLEDSGALNHTVTWTGLKEIFIFQFIQMDITAPEMWPQPTEG